MNVGVRLRDTDLVIDVDPRNFDKNDDPLARLVVDFGLPDAPFVLTGGGGKHLYFRKPAGVEVGGKLAAYSAVAMLRDLDAVEVLAASLEATAPVAVAEAGGAQALIAKHGHRTGAWFWSIAPIEDSLWEKMAEEHQTRHRVSVGDDE